MTGLTDTHRRLNRMQEAEKAVKTLTDWLGRKELYQERNVFVGRNDYHKLPGHIYVDCWGRKAVQ